MAQTTRNGKIEKLRKIIKNRDAAPLLRIDAAIDLIEQFGCSQRNVTCIRKPLLRPFLNSADPTILERAQRLRDTLIRGLDKPDTRTRLIKKLVTDARDNPQYPFVAGLSRSESTRLLRAVEFPESVPDGYKIGDCPLQPYCDRQKAYLNTTPTQYRTRAGEVAAAFAVGDDDEVVINALLPMAFVACMHEEWSQDVSQLLDALIAYGNARRLHWPRPTIPLMQEIERRDSWSR